MSEQKNIPNQTFDNFIVSRSNKIAYSACLDLANNPQGKFVVIYGANSLGKTHLLYAVNNALIRKKPDYLLRKEYLDHILKEYSVLLPSFVKKYLVYLSRMTFSVMKGFLCKLSFIEKQNGTKVSNLDIKKCLSSYVVWKLR